MADLSTLSDDELKGFINQYDKETGVDTFTSNGEVLGIDTPVDQNTRSSFFFDYKDPRATTPLEKAVPWAEKLVELAGDNKTLTALGVLTGAGLARPNTVKNIATGIRDVFRPASPSYSDSGPSTGKPITRGPSQMLSDDLDPATRPESLSRDKLGYEQASGENDPTAKASRKMFDKWDSVVDKAGRTDIKGLRGNLFDPNVHVAPNRFNNVDASEMYQPLNIADAKKARKLRDLQGSKYENIRLGDTLAQFSTPKAGPEGTYSDHLEKPKGFSKVRTAPITSSAPAVNAARTIARYGNPALLATMIPEAIEGARGLAAGRWKPMENVDPLNALPEPAGTGGILRRLQAVAKALDQSPNKPTAEKVKNLVNRYKARPGGNGK